MKSSVRIVSLALVAFATSGASLASTGAFSQVQVNNRTVQFDMAAAQTPDGARALYSKLRSAARDVCFEGGVTRHVGRWEQQACAVEAVDKAVRSVNVPAVEALHFRSGTVELIASR